MNKLQVLFVALVLVLGSCSKEKTECLPPTISFVYGTDFLSNDTILKIGEPFKIGIEAINTDVNLTNFIINVETEDVEVFLDSGMNTPHMYYEKTLIKGIADVEKWNFVIRDRDGNGSEVSLNIFKDTTSLFGNIKYYADITLGAQNNLLPSFYSLEQDSTYILSDAFLNQQMIDLCYYYDFIDTDENTIASPGANIDESVYPGEFELSNWATRRTARFKVANISEEDFLKASNDSLLIALYGQSEGKRKAKNLQQGNLFAFENQDGKVGIFIVNQISGTDDGSVNISLKIQE